MFFYGSVVLSRCKYEADITRTKILSQCILRIKLVLHSQLTNTNLLCTRL